MTKRMLIDAAHPEEVRVALLGQNKKIEDFDFESAAKKPLRGNIFLARVTRVEPSLQAAFVDFGGNRHGFLAFSEIHPDYYQIPVADREALQAAEHEVAELAAQLELAQRGDEDDGDDDHHHGDDHAEDVKAESADEGDAETSEKLKAGDDTDADDEDDSDESRDDADEEEEEEEDVKKADDADDTDDDADESGDAGADGDEQPWVDLEASGNEDGAPEEDAVEIEEEEETAEDDEDVVASDKGRKDREALFERYKDAKRKRSQLLRNYKIQEVIKRRQILLVQVVKEERGNKGAALTTYLSLAGRYCVLMPNTARGGGISRKIANSSDRRRLRRVVDSLEVPQGMGLIIRTAGAKRTKTEIKRDYDYLLRLWENIRSLTLKSIAPCLVYEEASLIKRAIRDLYDKDISKVLVEGETGYREAKDFMKMLMPSHAKNVQPYKERTPIFLKYGVESQLDGMYQPTVRLKSGGYIVIHQTEALVAIDVNSGRATRERNIEQTALRTNIEAAEEAARQFRLRDLAGLIVLDFIDMEEQRNNRKVERALKEAMKTDRARVQLGRISPFGLLELSRQRRRSGIVDGTTQACPTCSGAGVIRSHEMAALRILRAIEGEALSGKVGRIVVRASLDVSQHVLNHNRDWLQRIEDNNGVKVEIVADPDKAGDAYDLEKGGVPREVEGERAFIRADQTEAIIVEDDEEDEAPEQEATEDGDEQRGGRKRRRRRRRKDRTDNDAPENAAADEETSSDDDSGDPEERAARDQDDEDRGDGKRKRRRRGRRGGRRNRRNNDGQEGASEDSRGEEDSRSATEDGGEAEKDAAEQAPSPDQEESADEARLESSAEETVNGASSHDDAPAAETEVPEANQAEAPAEAEPAEAESSPKKPARKGWWQRALG